MFNDQELKGSNSTKKSNIRIIGSIVVGLSGVLLFLDKILSLTGIEGSNTFGFSNYSNFIWVLTQGIAPIILALGILLRPYFLSVLIPVYCYSIQIIWIFQPQYYYDNEYLHFYAIGSCFIFVLLFLFINKVSRIKHKNNLEIEQFIEKANTFMKEVDKSLIKN
ncbi:hypothetical protein A8C32_14730 [Flavivirga aquatica]|uniref:Uncharacterized protein n=1 Tax=Flavivirga aquatica TaxID=1849968 RepID=A0A1E5T9R9_9FLAO|nr:hypothetical protein [Flavivirga aquatica]OEK08088.1 hypothetical protein A8C32_14730 [Flavivirga aquatica]